MEREDVNEILVNELLNRAIAHVSGQCGMNVVHTYEECISNSKKAVLVYMNNAGMSVYMNDGVHI